MYLQFRVRWNHEFVKSNFLALAPITESLVFELDDTTAEMNIDFDAWTTERVRPQFQEEPESNAGSASFDD